MAILWVALTLWTTTAIAQDTNFVDPGKEQMDLYQAGAKAFKEQKWTKAIERFEASLAIGELNITYLNLGRTFFKSGQCHKAKAAYDKVATAPQIREPSPIQVLEKLDEYREELSTCPATITITCSDPQIAVSASPQVDGAACGKNLNVPAGKYTFTGALGDLTVERTVEVKSMDKTKVALRFAVAKDDSDSGAGLRTAGWVTAGIGVAALATGGVLFAINSSDADRFDELNAQGLSCPADPNCAELESLQDSLDSANVQIGVSVGVGAAALLTGAALIFMGYSQDDDEEAQTGLTPLWQPGLIGVQGRF